MNKEELLERIDELNKKSREQEAQLAEAFINLKTDLEPKNILKRVGANAVAKFRALFIRNKKNSSG